MNIVEFALKMKDMASQPVRNFGQAVSQTFSRANAMAANLGTHNRVLGQSYTTLGSTIKQVENTVRTSTIPAHIRTARRELEALQRQSNIPAASIGGRSAAGGGITGMLGGFGNIMRGAAIGLAITAMATFGSGISDSISKSLERQQIQTSFNVLTGSEEKGGALTKQLVGLQKNTILGGEVFKNAQTLMGFGFKSEEVYNSLKMLGDVSMGNKDRFQALTLAFSQTKAAGRLMGQDLLQYVNAGFNPLQVISEKTGKSIGKLKVDMEKGLIPFTLIQQAFKDATSEGGRFENMLSKIAETPAGKLQALSGRWNEFKVSAGAAFMPLVAMALDLAQKAMPAIEGLINPLANGVQRIANWIVKIKSETGGWMDYVNIINGYMTNHIVPLFHKMWEYVSNAGSQLFDFIGRSQILKDIFSFIVWRIGLIVDGIKLMVSIMDFWLNNVVMPVLNALEKIYKLITFRNNNSNAQLAASGAKAGAMPSAAEKKEGQTTHELLTNIADNTASNNASASGTDKAITGGGQKVINISVAKFLDNINLTTMNVSEGTAEIEKIFIEMFSRVIVNAVN